MRRFAWLLLTAVTAAGILLLFVFPGRVLLAQDREIAVTRQHITALERTNTGLRQEIGTLNDPAAIAQIARQRFGLVPRGTSLYNITAPPASGPTKVAARASVHHESWWQHLEIWH